MKKRTKLTIGLLTGITSIAIIGGVTAGVVINKNNNQTMLNENFDNQLSTNESVNDINTKDNNVEDQIVGSENITNNGMNDIVVNEEEIKEGTITSRLFELNRNQISNDSSSDLLNRDVTRITKEFQSGNIKTPVLSQYGNKVTEQELYQSSYYYNQRDFMPILSSEKMYNYPNERNAMSVIHNSYYGWDIVDEVYMNSNGNVLSSKKDYAAIKYLKYSPTNELTNYFGKTNKVYSLDFDCGKMMDDNLSIDELAKKINNFMQSAINSYTKIEFITIRKSSQELLEKLVVPSGIKKLTIIDYTEGYWSQLSSLRGIQIPASVQELEFYSNSANKIDPLILPSTTHMIYDHIDDSNYNIRQANFSMIDLSTHTNLTNDELQKAIDIVYGQRQFERNFQGDFVGGYIYQLDISNTPIKTLNNVFIPSQSDNRFNIAYVKWSSTLGNGQIEINIGSDKPSNDSLVGEWWDVSTNPNTATKLVLTSTGEVKIDTVVNEVVGQIKKFPLIKEIDLKGVSLLDSKTLSDLVNAIKDRLNNIELNSDEFEFIIK
ncbi:MAG: IgG-blocking protein M [Ureaplasma sp.]|nr:IgG-blocking protein M [Ureaplasma sp.]